MNRISSVVYNNYACLLRFCCAARSHTKVILTMFPMVCRANLFVNLKKEMSQVLVSCCSFLAGKNLQFSISQERDTILFEKGQRKKKEEKKEQNGLEQHPPP